MKERTGGKEMIKNLSLFDMKLAAMEEALSDEAVFHAISYSGIADAGSWKELKGKAVFDHMKAPDTLDQPTTFLTFLAHTDETEGRKSNDPWITQSLEITIWTPENQLHFGEAPEISFNRNDYIAQLLIWKFHGRTYLGSLAEGHSINLLDRLMLISSSEGSSGSYLYRKLIFSARDFSSISGESM